MAANKRAAYYEELTKDDETHYLVYSWSNRWNRHICTHMFGQAQKSEATSLVKMYNTLKKRISNGNNN